MTVCSLDLLIMKFFQLDEKLKKPSPNYNILKRTKRQDLKNSILKWIFLYF